MEEKDQRVPTYYARVPAFKCNVVDVPIYNGGNMSSNAYPYGINLIQERLKKGKPWARIFLDGVDVTLKVESAPSKLDGVEEVPKSRERVYWHVGVPLTIQVCEPNRKKIPFFGDYTLRKVDLNEELSEKLKNWNPPLHAEHFCIIIEVDANGKFMYKIMFSVAVHLVRAFGDI